MGILEISFLFLWLRARRKKTDPDIPTEAEIIKSEAEENLSIVKERQKNAKLINAWINQMNTAKNRPSILSWRFQEHSAENILFCFSGETCEREGKVYFIYDRAFPHVSQLQYFENGNKKFLKGYIIKNFTLDQLYQKFSREKQDKERLAYLNNVSMKALIEGQSEFDILEYQRITETEFTQTFGKKEIRSLIKLLKEDFKDVDQTEVPWVFRVTTALEPVESDL